MRPWGGGRGRTRQWPRWCGLSCTGAHAPACSGSISGVAARSGVAAGHQLDTGAVISGAKGLVFSCKVVVWHCSTRPGGELQPRPALQPVTLPPPILPLISFPPQGRACTSQQLRGGGGGCAAAHPAAAARSHRPAQPAGHVCSRFLPGHDVLHLFADGSGAALRGWGAEGVMPAHWRPCQHHGACGVWSGGGWRAWEQLLSAGSRRAVFQSLLGLQLQ